jgi:hypothetical protein
MADRLEEHGQMGELLRVEPCDDEEYLYSSSMRH